MVVRESWGMYRKGKGAFENVLLGGMTYIHGVSEKHGKYLSD